MTQPVPGVHENFAGEVAMRKEPQPDAWQHRVKMVNWSEWREGKANLSEAYIRSSGIQVEERPLYLHPPSSEITRLQKENAELEAALDEKEIASGLTSNGNLWRFWSGKARDLAVSNARLQNAYDDLKDDYLRRHTEATDRWLRIQELQKELETAREDALKEAAKVAYDYDARLVEYPSECAKQFYEGGANDASLNIAANIRALQKKEATE